MPTGVTTAIANANLDSLLDGATYYMQLHVGDPGAAGTSNGATETTRQAITFGAASAGASSNDLQVQWTNIAGSQDATFFSFWTLSSGGTFRFSGSITANPYTAGDTLTFAVGAVVVTHAGIAS